MVEGYNRVSIWFILFTEIILCTKIEYENGSMVIKEQFMDNKLFVYFDLVSLCHKNIIFNFFFDNFRIKMYLNKFDYSANKQWIVLTCNDNYDIGINNFFNDFYKNYVRVDMFRNVKLKAQRLSHFIMQMAVRTQETQAYTTMIFLACSRINSFFHDITLLLLEPKSFTKGLFLREYGLSFLDYRQPTIS